MTNEKPEFVTDEHLEFLDDLRESGATNMFGARPYLQQAFGFNSEDSLKALRFWMDTFSKRQDNART